MAGSNSSSPAEVDPNLSPYACAQNFVTVKLSGRKTYTMWKTQILCLLESHDMRGFVEEPAENMGVLGKEKYMLWKRSDALVKGLILGSLSQQTLKYIIPNNDFTAKDVWEKLRTIYGPLEERREGSNPGLGERSIFLKARTREQDMTKNIGGRKKVIKLKSMRYKATKQDGWRKETAAAALYSATLNRDFKRVEYVLSGKKVTLRDKITINDNTALHVAVATTKVTEFLEKMFDMARKDNEQPLDMRNSEGSTLLHVAAIVGNTEAAKLLVKNDLSSFYVKDIEGKTPVARALSNMQRETYDFFTKCDEYVNYQEIETGGSASCELLVNTISSKDYGSALPLCDGKMLYELVSNVNTTVLMAIAQNFPRKLNFWERAFHKSLFELKYVEDAQKHETNYYDAKCLLHDICFWIRNETEFSLHRMYYNNAILEATKQNAVKVVKIIVDYFPYAIWSTNEDGHNIIQYAVIHRSQNIYNLLYQMSEHKNIYRTIKDRFGNNLLHLAARLASSSKLDPISGAALQIQFELQWFEEVENFICPLNRRQKNSFGETPQMIFTRQHKDLVNDGETWMKDTAGSYTITAALIITIVFAAAITVPGGNRENGLPMFSNQTAFQIFAVSDAISLFTSVTSLLMFLSILTARFSEQDFRKTLPTKLIIGLATLFISTSAMLVAFGATLFLVFGQNSSWILVPIAALTCLPITSFMTLQYPLMYDLISSTYGRSYFGKKSGRIFY